MALGCILCQEPLVTSSHFKLQKQKYLRGRPTKPQAGEGKADEVRAHQILLAKCGHLFHKHCLKNYMINPTTGAMVKRECPFCFKPVTLPQCIEVFPNIDGNDEQMEKIRLAHQTNDKMHQHIRELKQELTVKNDGLKLLRSDAANFREKLKMQRFEIEKLVRPPESMQTLKDRLSSKENLLQSLSEQNTKLVELIQKQAIRIQSKTNKAAGVEAEPEVTAERSNDHVENATKEASDGKDTNDLIPFFRNMLKKNPSKCSIFFPNKSKEEICSSLASMCEQYRTKLPPYFLPSNRPKITIQNIDEGSDDDQIIENHVNKEQNHDYKAGRVLKPKCTKNLQFKQNNLAVAAESCQRSAPNDRDLASEYAYELQLPGVSNSRPILRRSEKVCRLTGGLKKKSAKKISKKLKKVIRK